MKTPLNYTGTKQNTLEFLFSNFVKDTDTVFVDLFTGGGSVSVYALEKKIL